MSHFQDGDGVQAGQMVKPGQQELHEYDPSYKFDVGCCGSRKLHTVKLKPKLGFINIKKKHGFCLCCMRQTNGSALVKNIKSLEVMSPQKSIVVAYILWLLLGIVGGHRFYTGRWRTGLLWMITFGLMGIGWLIDVCLIPGWIGSSFAHINVAGHQRTDVFEHIMVSPLDAKKLRNDIQTLQHIV